MNWNLFSRIRFFFFDWLWHWWIPIYPLVLRDTEKKLLKCLKVPFRRFYVDIGPVVDDSDKIWTLALNQESSATPLVLLHGLGSGVALWSLNLDALSADRPVYAIDLLGFGRSCRPEFAEDAVKVEEQFVRSIEEWRKEMNLDRIIILGHNFGGFLAFAYALKYPERVVHLITADLWGLSEKPKHLERQRSSIWYWLASVLWRPLKPLFAVRAAGPYGPWVIEKARPDLLKKFATAHDCDVHDVSQYIFQCNAQVPTGEAAFQCMAFTNGWAKNPLINRIGSLHSGIAVTLLYGSRSWIDYKAILELKEKRHGNALFDVQVISGAGNHSYADKYEIFNRYVREACNHSDIK